MTPYAIFSPLHDGTSTATTQLILKSYCHQDQQFEKTNYVSKQIFILIYEHKTFHIYHFIQHKYLMWASIAIGQHLPPPKLTDS